MGDRKRRRDRFFAKHQHCCFCGGQSPATTEDHQPGRVFFKGRDWPEGFVFPACDKCNATSAPSEKLLALLIHGEAESDDRDDYRNLLTSIRSEYPDLIRSMLPASTREVRNILKAKGLNKPQGATYADVPVLKLPRDFWNPHLEMVSRKLLLALHYQCFEVPLSAGGGLWWFFHTNADFLAGDFPMEIMDLATNIARPIRQKRLLDSQFLVRWNVIPDSRTAVFMMLFHGSLSISGVTTEAPHPLRRAWKQKPLKPFEW